MKQERQGVILGIIGCVVAVAWVLFMTAVFHQIDGRIWQYAMLGTVWVVAVICYLSFEDRRRYRTTYTERERAIAKEKESDKQAGIIKSEDDYLETLAPPYCKRMPFLEQKLYQSFIIHTIVGIILTLITWCPEIYDELFWYLPTISIKWPGF
jgi:Ca2+/Na+ antiporter